MRHLETRRFANASSCEYYMHGRCGGLDELRQVFDDLANTCTTHAASMIYMRLFAKKRVFEAAQTVLADISSLAAVPVTWLEQPEKAGVDDLSFQAYAVSRTDVERIGDGGQISGSRFTDGHANYVHLAVRSPAGESADRSARFVFETMQRQLESVRSDFSRTVRTWLFADDILSWYGQLNTERDAFFRRHNIFDNLVPASTGIGAANPFGAALTAELTTVEPLDGRVRVDKVLSPMQCEALNYRSSFSRAVAVTTPDYRKMYVSGTASIGPDGKTEHVDDCARQIALTMDVIGALLRNAEMIWADSAQAIAYFKRGEDFRLFDDYCRRNGLELPHVKLEADICRHELLFELELTLCRPNAN